MAKSGFFNVMLFSGFWALQIFLTKLSFNAGAQVLPYQTFSVLTALVMLAIWVLPGRRPEVRSLIKGQPALFWKLFFANGIQSGLGTCFSIIGISLTNAINAGFLVKLATITTVIFAWLILKERLTPTKILMVALMLSGAYLLTTRGETLLPRSGDLFILAACVCWSLGNVLVRKYLLDQKVDPDLVTLQKPLAGLPVILVLGVIALWNPGSLSAQVKVLAWSVPDPQLLWFALGNGILLALTWTFLNRTLKVTTASYMTMMSMVTPVIVSALAVIFLGETLAWIQALGAGVIILSGAVTYLGDLAEA